MGKNTSLQCTEKRKIQVVYWEIGFLLLFIYKKSITYQTKKEYFPIVVCLLVDFAMSLDKYLQKSCGCMDSLSKVEPVL